MNEVKEWRQNLRASPHPPGGGIFSMPQSTDEPETFFFPYKSTSVGSAVLDSVSKATEPNTAVPVKSLGAPTAGQWYLASKADGAELFLSHPRGSSQCTAKAPRAARKGKSQHCPEQLLLGEGRWMSISLSLEVPV